MTWLRIFLLVCAAALSFAQVGQAEPGSSWVRGVVRAARFIPGKDAHETFQLHVVRSDNGSLIGMAVLSRKISKKLPAHLAIEVEGIEAGGGFWPFVRGEVSDDLDANWEEIRTPTPSGHVSSRRIEPETLGESTFVDLSGFRSYIGQKRYGRVLLLNGEAATFFLNNLKPPGTLPGTWERAGLATDEELHPTLYEGTFLVPSNEQQELINLYVTRVEGEKDRVTGYFVYAGARSPTEEEKKAQYLDPTSLGATLQVGHDYRDDWQPIGPSVPQNDAVRVTAPPAVTMNNCAIRLDRFRSFIGKYRFGRVVLPSGASTVIQLFDLLPPEKELIAKEQPEWLQEVAERAEGGGITIEARKIVFMAERNNPK